MKKSLRIATVLLALVLLLTAGTALAEGCSCGATQEEWVDNGDGTHYKKCGACQARLTENAKHTYTGATCTTKGVCVCGAEGDYGDHSWTHSAEWSANNASCTVTSVCANDSSHTNKVTTNDIYRVGAGTACGSGIGYTLYARITINGKSYMISKSVTGTDTHYWSETTYKWSNDLSSCTASRYCRKGDANETATAKVSKYTEKDGSVVYTASFDSSASWAKEQTKTIKASGGTTSKHDSEKTGGTSGGSSWGGSSSWGTISGTNTGKTTGTTGGTSVVTPISPAIPQTGDGSILAIAAAMIAAGMLIALAAKRRKAN